MRIRHADNSRSHRARSRERNTVPLPNSSRPAQRIKHTQKNQTPLPAHVPLHLPRPSH
ncbi:hypothetical protein EJ06DRAFT_529793 [Trichodelitschia bisporula]|uniref:Uncharacterized protein n=1 Tax=Trichodelitschia bisporula TaxID=703511 RepID=A0A6G1HY63_9PEZI|nr:hypothetical protein EJ06DRAFT_529793 [Trichodelitschia bisporula]